MWRPIGICVQWSGRPSSCRSRNSREVASPGLGEHLSAASSVQPVLTEDLVVAHDTDFEAGGIVALDQQAQRAIVHRPETFDENGG